MITEGRCVVLIICVLLFVPETQTTDVTDIQGHRIENLGHPEVTREVTRDEGEVMITDTQTITQFVIQNGVRGLIDRVYIGEWSVTRRASLVEFLIASSTGRQLYLLYDQHSESIAASVKASYSRGGDIGVYNYQGSISPLEYELKSYFHRENLRNVIVMCSSTNTVDVFRQIYDRKMESPTIYWWVILEDDVTQQVLDNMREGTQISVALRVDESKYNLMRSFVNKEDELKLQNVGSWWWTPAEGPQHFLKEPLYKDLMDVYSDFGGRLMKSSVVDNWPFFRVMKDEASGAIVPDAGIDFHVLNTIAAKLNFTYELLLAEDGQWGGVLPDGSITGMIGMVARHEVHFAINEITITGPREVVVDFTLPYFLESTTIVSPAPAEKNRAFAVFSPFTAEVWGLLSLATLLVGPILWLISWAKEKHVLRGTWHADSLSNYTFNMFRSMVVQGNKTEMLQWSHRFLLFTWFFFCYVVYALYAGTLTAVLAVPTFEKPIDSLWDLLTAIEEDGYKATVVYQTSNEFIFKEATSGIYKQIWDVFDPSVGYVYTWDEGVEKVLTGKYAYMNAQLGAEIRAIKRGIHNYHFAKNTFYPQGYAMALPSGSPYKGKFEKLLIQLASAGLVDKWTRDEVAKVAGAGGGEASKGPGAITVVHLQAAFFLLAIGYSTAGSVLLLERLARFCYGRKEFEPTYVGRSGAFKGIGY
ncbi:glutamate receptor ionotropic, delta-2-like [Penaeus japonicus]|uniref:glutamate receptor ionotropic, delta-2-like n=1 Tax=Penaeus japonicus TaxID=27405 RepID=UPI001C70E663|nr:glutamate receptor ionotropic, delta-2-like [Penaeus japonicus]